MRGAVMKRTGIIAGIVIIAIGFLVLILLNANETSIIVWGGIRGFRALQYIQTAVICIGAVVAIVSAIPFIKAQIRETKAVEAEARKLAENYTKKEDK